MAIDIIKRLLKNLVMEKEFQGLGVNKARIEEAERSAGAIEYNDFFSPVVPLQQMINFGMSGAQ